ncbi:hypothetical protein SDRG_07306 [Saprolegnia diclina VS20]|uniref:Uncharacterized protein n=1 Tax=Saprolegnia diclina (strain VS20) TaxID=1156394 RepID=T0QB18_SAPDV|nr:hypothetical protein SDRG_07306 [Saprolegnia diclina VS20]EQC35069.1 hypothetical protein SDRG_07306 [Saprolegnia diclina VS20]|eukprot:XP_008611353.1 hypothetical protein SDRG_07306 [Saprolegnia diclina VS20]
MARHTSDVFVHDDDDVPSLPPNQEPVLLHTTGDDGGRPTEVGTLQRDHGLKEFGEWDRNGILCRQWRSSLLGALCVDVVPNGIVSILLPCVPLGQVSHRLGLRPFSTMAALTGVLYVTAIACSGINDLYAHSAGAVASLLLVVLVTSLRTTVRHLFFIPGSCLGDVCAVLWCGCCTVAQLAAHVQAYEPHTCSLRPHGVLAGYKE